MESTVSATTIFSLSKATNSSSKSLVSLLNRHFSITSDQILQKRSSSGRISCICYGDFRRSNEFVSISLSATSLRSLHVAAPTSSRLACLSNPTGSFASGGGGEGFDGGNGGSGGDGDGGSNGGETKSKSITGNYEEISTLSPDVIILNVGGMTCGGCAASVKRILESQPQVSSASVDLATETAFVWPVSEVKDTQDWQRQLGETLAKHLTNCGFKSNLRVQGAVEGEISS